MKMESLLWSNTVTWILKHVTSTWTFLTSDWVVYLWVLESYGTDLHHSIHTYGIHSSKRDAVSVLHEVASISCDLVLHKKYSISKMETQLGYSYKHYSLHLILTNVKIIWTITLIGGKHFPKRLWETLGHCSTLSSWILSLVTPTLNESLPTWIIKLKGDPFGRGIECFRSSWPHLEFWNVLATTTAGPES